MGDFDYRRSKERQKLGRSPDFYVSINSGLRIFAISCFVFGLLDEGSGHAEFLVFSTRLRATPSPGWRRGRGPGRRGRAGRGGSKSQKFDKK